MKEFSKAALAVHQAEAVRAGGPPGGSCWAPVFPWQQSAPCLELRGLQRASLQSGVKTLNTVKKGEFRKKHMKLKIIASDVSDSQLPEG